MTVGSFTNAPVDNREAESISHHVEITNQACICRIIQGGQLTPNNYSNEPCGQPQPGNRVYSINFATQKHNSEYDCGLKTCPCQWENKRYISWSC